MSSTRILLIIPELGMGGAQRSLAKLSAALVKSHDVTVVVFNRNHVVSYPIGGKMISLDVIPGPGILSKTFAFFCRVRKLKRIKKEIGADVSISFLEGADYINILSKRRDKVIISIRGSKLHDETIIGNFAWLRNKVLIPFLYRFADTIVTVNQGIIKELTGSFNLKRSKIVHIPNFYDSFEIRELSEELKSAPLARVYRQRPVFVVSGRLAPEKGIQQMIVVFSKLKISHPDAVLLIIGDGPLLKELLDIATHLGLTCEMSENFISDPDVLFLGNQPNVFKFFKGASAYLMNSSSEGFPNSLVEAMICGVPVISSDCPYGPREILAPEVPYVSPATKPYFCESGVLMPLLNAATDSDAWVSVLTNLISNKDLCANMAVAGRKRASIFNKENIMLQWKRVIAEK
jgi:glycosyltransferase involved in cell wall biosynthesis